jgi:hypothetical protein
MTKYLVEYEVRNLGAIGIFWLKSDIIEAEGIEDAMEKFRQKWGKKFEFRFPAQCYSLYA